MTYTAMVVAHAVMLAPADSRAPRRATADASELWNTSCVAHKVQAFTERL